MDGVGSGGTKHYYNNGCFKDAYESSCEKSLNYNILKIDAYKIMK